MTVSLSSTTFSKALVQPSSRSHGATGSLTLEWVDAETGERLHVAVTGSEALVRRLLAAGFLISEDQSPVADPEETRDSPAGRQVGRRQDGNRTGASGGHGPLGSRLPEAPPLGASTIEEDRQRPLHQENPCPGGDRPRGGGAAA